jgi:outer membrane protein OmpA-like peptidoglycan-associated protein
MTENLVAGVNERRASSDERAPQAEHPAAIALGLAAGIVVVGGLTWLFRGGPAPLPKIGTASQVKALRSSSGGETGRSTHIAAAPGLKGGAGVNQPSEVAASVPATPIESLLSFLKHGRGKEAVFDLDWVSFNAGKATLTPSSYEQLRQIATVLSAYPIARVVIGVHSDNGGSKAQSVRLSAERARSVRKEFVRLGVGQFFFTSTGKRTGKGREPPPVSGEDRVHDSHVWISVRKK